MVFEVRWKVPIKLKAICFKILDWPKEGGGNVIKTIAKASAVFGASLVLMGGVAGATPMQHNKKNKPQNIVICEVMNGNTVGVSNGNVQSATTGKAKVANNTKTKHMNEGNVVAGGDAVSGNATNNNTTTMGVQVTNGPTDSCGCGCATLVGDSVMPVSSKNVTKITNLNTVSVGNSSIQNATSGNATVWGNTNGGSATTGNALNNNTSTISVVVSNN